MFILPGKKIKITDVNLFRLRHIFEKIGQLNFMLKINTSIKMKYTQQRRHLILKGGHV